ncbi:MAG: hypothetical protein LBO20_04560 [Bifidobacteriaceae bacterium]|jgi:hypothetical protein|nr:hypothetical protein [Bifidobacteriaceae bacterium]
MSGLTFERVWSLAGDFFRGFASPMPLLLVASVPLLIALVISAMAPARRQGRYAPRHIESADLATRLTPRTSLDRPPPRWPVGMDSPLAQRDLRAARAARRGATRAAQAAATAGTGTAGEPEPPPRPETPRTGDRPV